MAYYGVPHKKSIPPLPPIMEELQVPKENKSKGTWKILYKQWAYLNPLFIYSTRIAVFDPSELSFFEL